MSEKSLQSEIILAIGKNCPAVRIFRNNCGKGVCGSKYVRIDRPQTVTLHPGDWVVRQGRMVDFGLFHGSGDLIGYETVATPRPVARFLSIECKTPTGKIDPAQETWARNVRAAGGKAVIARSVDEAVTGVLNLVL